jgi:hemoglobin
VPDPVDSERRRVRHHMGMHVGLAARDIENRDDCERLVRAFYGRALADPVIGRIFVNVAQLDLDAYVPRIASFWETILLRGGSYSGGAFRPHADLHARVGLRAGHFERWLWLWSTTVDELFAGQRAELAKAHAARVATAFHARLESQPAGRQRAATRLEITQHRPARVARDDVPGVRRQHGRRYGRPRSRTIIVSPAPSRSGIPSETGDAGDRRRHRHRGGFGAV